MIAVIETIKTLAKTVKHRFMLLAEHEQSGYAGSAKRTSNNSFAYVKLNVEEALKPNRITPNDRM